jgi:hypothetical protein
MFDAVTLAQINGEYVLPPDAGPAWRAACQMGYDMSLIQDWLNKTPEERLDEHQHMVNLMLQIEAARTEQN